MARRRFDLYVRNKRDEYITTIELHRSEGDNNIIDTLPSKFVVADYTRDGDVMEATASSVGALTMVAVRDQHRLKSFRSYLASRKKAGVVKHPGGGRLCMLPVGGSGVAHCESIVVLIDGNCGGGGARSGASSAGETSYSRNDDNSPRRAPPPPTPPSGDSEGGMPGDTGGIGGLLGSIMSTISQTHKGVAKAAPVDRVAQAQERHIKRRVERFKAQVREQLEAFSTDPVATSHVFPHVEKSLRAIQHGLVDYFDGITARTEGDADDRHVVVYKLGYEPPDDEVQLDPQVLIAPARKVSSSPASAASMPAFVPVGEGEKGSDAGDLVRIGTIVKDRRTVQEIEEASRKRRRHGYDQ